MIGRSIKSKNIDDAKRKERIGGRVSMSWEQEMESSARDFSKRLKMLCVTCSRQLLAFSEKSG